MEMKPRLYLETTIPSYLTSRPSRDLIIAGHQQITRDWWNHRKDQFEIYLSQLVIDEARAGDAEAAQQRLNAIKTFPLLDITQEVEELATHLMNADILPAKAVTDAAHIAIAAVHGIEFLMTWNCVHLANAILAREVAKICRQHDYDCPVICTPEELMGEYPI